MNKISFAFALAVLLSACGDNSQRAEPLAQIPKTEIQSVIADSSKDLVTVNADNFVRAETDMYFSTAVEEAGGTGKFFHRHELMSIDNQAVIRANRDVLYSSGVFDLDAAPVTITLPDPGKRFMSMMIIDEDHYTKTVYAPGTFTFNKGRVGTRYVMLALRTFIDPNDEKDIARVKSLQEAVTIEQASKGSFEIPHWDQVSQKRIHDSLVESGKKFTDTREMFGTKQEVDSERHMIGTATGWGGNTEKDALYISSIPSENNGTVYTLKVKKVPVDGFWSVSVYNKEGYFQKNDQNAYSLNNVTAKMDADSSVTIQFGGCDGRIPNCIPIMPGWNYWVRLYRPRKEILDGSWKFPDAHPVK
jgi:hypothetical protein